MAAEHLKNRGWTLLERNYRTPYGELDLVARKGGTLLFVEVKTRTSEAFGMPEEAITPVKAEHLLNAARHYLQQHPEFDGTWRVDVCAIQGQPGHTGTQIAWFENVLS